MFDSAQNYLNYTSEVLGVKFIISNKPSLQDKVTVVFDKNLGVQEQLVFTKITDAINLKDYSSQVLLPGQSVPDVINSIPSQKVICFFKDSNHEHGIFEEQGRECLFTHSIQDLVGPNSDKSLLERKKQTWNFLKKFI